MYGIEYRSYFSNGVGGGLITRVAFKLHRNERCRNISQNKLCLEEKRVFGNDRETTLFWFEDSITTLNCKEYLEIVAITKLRIFVFMNKENSSLLKLVQG